MSNKKLLITIEENQPHATITFHKENSIIEKKVVDLQKFSNALNANILFDTGILPKGTRFFCNTRYGYVIGIETPALSKVIGFINYNKEISTVTVPFPHCLFMFNIVDKSIYYSYVYALEKPISSENNRLFRFPYGNSSRAGGVICWGTLLDSFKFEDNNSLPYLVCKFFDSAYNGDLFEYDTISFSELSMLPEYVKDENNINFYTFLKTMANISEFPVNILIQDGNKTIASEMMRHQNE